jgi:hypothetical protein
MSVSCQKRKSWLSFDHFVGAAEHREWKRDAERAGGLEIDFHLNFRDLLYGQIGRQFSSENPACVSPKLSTSRLPSLARFPRPSSSKKNVTRTSSAVAICCNREAPIRLTPFSYFCTC